MEANYKITTLKIFGNYAPVYNYHATNEIINAFFYDFKNIEKSNCIGVWKIKQLKNK